MGFRKYTFLIGLLCVLIMQSSYVQASEAVFDEIEKFVSPTEEMQIDKPFQQDFSPSNQTNIEEQPVINEEQSSENEVMPVKTETVKQQKNSDKKIKDKPNQEDLSVKTQKINEDNSALSVVEEKQTVNIEQNDNLEVEIAKSDIKLNKKLKILLSKFSDKCSNFFARLQFDKIIALKETVIQYLAYNQFFDKFSCEQEPEPRQIEHPRDFIPYYFLYIEPLKNLLENITFPENINNPREFLPYIYMIKNYEIKIEPPKGAVTPQGTTDIRILMNAPSPQIKVLGKSLFAKIVVDIKNNTLYKYDEYGFPLKAYLIATGARGSRTMAGLRIVTHKEKFPYRGAPKNCKRLFDPYSYGPYIIFFNSVNPKTGKQYGVDQFLHGNGNERSIGRKVSHGCMRTNNNVMRNELSKEVNRGDYALLINPD